MTVADIFYQYKRKQVLDTFLNKFTISFLSLQSAGFLPENRNNETPSEREKRRPKKGENPSLT